MRMELVEVGPRDGLQNESVHFSTGQKVEFVRRVAAAGLRRVETSSFVNPKRVPQMADAEAVVAGLADVAGLSQIGLVLNTQGWHRAEPTAISEANVVVICTDTFAQKNSGTDSKGTLRMAEEVTSLAHAAGRTVSATVSASFGCPYEGEVPVSRTVEMAARCAEAGMDEIALADTIGAADPADVERRVTAVRKEIGDGVRLRAHFHNTRNTGYANAWVAANCGVTTLDASLGGIGGCPFAPRATGNIATEDLLHMLQRGGFETGVDLTALLEASAWLEEQLGRPVPGLVSKAGPFPT